MRLLLRYLWEAFLAWRLEGRHFRDIKVGCKYVVLDGFVYWYSEGEEWRGPYETVHEHSGAKPSFIYRMLKIGHYELFDPSKSKEFQSANRS